MNRIIHLPLARSALLAGFACLILGAGLAYSQSAAQAGSRSQEVQETSLHPTFPLLDENGVNVLESRQPISTMETCGACHDTGFIASHSFHADAGLSGFGLPGSQETGHSWDTSPGQFGSWNPIEYRYLSPAGDALTDLTTPEWLMRFGAGHIGGGPAEFARDGRPLEDLTPGESVESLAPDPETGELVAWDWSESGTVEMNCFLCHLNTPDLDARAAALASGDFGWANTATLGATGIITPAAEGFSYNRSAFLEDGSLNPDFMTPQDPTNTNCGSCHGVVHTNANIPLTDEGISAWRTSTTGQIISPQAISDSGLNISGKDALSRSWDVHAERVVECTDCHFSLNNPVYSDINPDAGLDHLTFDPRRVDLGAYLLRPVHDFARGPNSQDAIAPDLAGTMRRCEACHAAESAHSWLPYSDRHLAALSCETCHIPRLYAPAYEQMDWTVLTLSAEPRVSYRGIADPDADVALLTGFEPVLLPSTDVDGQTKLAPFNLVTSFYWIYGPEEDSRPVPQDLLEAAWLEDGAYPQAILDAFDQDANGRLDSTELVLDSDEKTALIAGRLAALGLQDPRIAGEVQAYAIHHDVAADEWATRDCQTCHAEDSRITRPVILAGAAPGGVIPAFVSDPASEPGGTVTRNALGALEFSPMSEENSLYLLGHDSVGWIDGFGMLAFFGVLAGVTVHGGLRTLAARRRVSEAETPEVRAVYMYSVYERLWHWLQTAAILLLLLTGLIIHKPETFGIFSFRYVVLVHNGLALILVVNAALSLFYHLASGEIQQYLPRPRGFFDDAIVQARFYLKGIFRGDLHPFEKTPDRKLNPLQQMTYFGILNLLLPLQIITGGLMWGAQRWPELAGRLGGLAFLGPFHSLVAWMFASFIVAHVYLTTTGPYPSAAIKAMMLGWDEVEVHHAPAEADASPAD